MQLTEADYWIAMN